VLINKPNEENNQLKEKVGGPGARIRQSQKSAGTQNAHNIRKDGGPGIPRPHSPSEEKANGGEFTWKLPGIVVKSQ